jgi:hypothetical protein
MNRYLLFLLLILLSITNHSCDDDGNCIDGVGPIITETLELEPFTKISLEGSMNLIISQGDKQQVLVTGHENIIPLIGTEIEDGEWEIVLGEDCIRNFELTIEIELPNIEKIELEGSGNIDIGPITTVEDKLSIYLEGSGNIASTGNSTIDELEIELDGSGNIDVYTIDSRICDIKLEGSGNIYVSVEETLKVDLTGSGNIHFRGDPTIDSSISGSGNVIDDN